MSKGKSVSGPVTGGKGGSGGGKGPGIGSGSMPPWKWNMSVKVIEPPGGNICESGEIPINVD